MPLTSLVRHTLATFGTVVLLTACSGSNDDTEVIAGAAQTGANAYSADPAAPDEVDTFCSDAESAFSDLQTAANGTAPSSVPALLSDVVRRLEEIDAPAEIAGQWATLTGALDLAVGNTQSLDLNTVEGQQAFTEEFNRLTTTAADAQAAVASYVGAHCGFDSEPPATEESVADAVAEAGVSQDLVARLAQIASNTGYGTSRGAPLNQQQALNFALIQIQTCRDIRSGRTTAVEVIAQDVADGASRSDAEAMSDFLDQTYCPAVRG